MTPIEAIKPGPKPKKRMVLMISEEGLILKICDSMIGGEGYRCEMVF